MLVMGWCCSTFHIEGQRRRYLFCIAISTREIGWAGKARIGKISICKAFHQAFAKQGVLVINLPLRYRRSLAFDISAQTQIP